MELIKFGEFIAELYEKADLHLAHIDEFSSVCEVDLALLNNVKERIYPDYLAYHYIHWIDRICSYRVVPITLDIV